MVFSRVLTIGILTSTTIALTLRHIHFKPTSLRRSTLMSQFASYQTAASSDPVRRLPRVLSIQSHTVHGYVGNKASTLPLQCLGYHVDAVNTVTLSNHPGYGGGAKGKSLDEDSFKEIMDGLEANDLLQYDVVLSGYMRSDKVMISAAEYIRNMRKVKPNMFYVCDPVLGDNGRFYVPSELRDVYLQHLIPQATVITPNQFEAETLTGIKIDSILTAQQACLKFHALGVPICILKGIQLPDNLYAILISISSPFSFHGVEIMPDSLQNSFFQINVNQISSRTFSGCGDLFSSLTAGMLYQAMGTCTNPGEQELEHDVCASMERVVATMSHVLSTTQLMESKELCIVESIDTFRGLRPAVFNDAIVSEYPQISAGILLSLV